MAYDFNRLKQLGSQGLDRLKTGVAGLQQRMAPNPSGVQLGANGLPMGSAAGGPTVNATAAANVPSAATQAAQAQAAGRVPPIQPGTPPPAATPAAPANPAAGIRKPPGLLRSGLALGAAVGGTTAGYDAVQEALGTPNQSRIGIENALLDTGLPPELSGGVSGGLDALQKVGNAATFGVAGRIGDGLSSALGGGSFMEGFRDKPLLPGLPAAPAAAPAQAAAAANAQAAGIPQIGTTNIPKADPAGVQLSPGANGVRRNYSDIAGRSNVSVVPSAAITGAETGVRAARAGGDPALAGSGLSVVTGLNGRTSIRKVAADGPRVNVIKNTSGTGPTSIDSRSAGGAASGIGGERALAGIRRQMRSGTSKQQRDALDALTGYQKQQTDEAQGNALLGIRQEANDIDRLVAEGKLAGGMDASDQIALLNAQINADRLGFDRGKEANADRRANNSDTRDSLTARFPGDENAGIRAEAADYIALAQKNGDRTSEAELLNNFAAAKLLGKGAYDQSRRGGGGLAGDFMNAITPESPLANAGVGAVLAGGATLAATRSPALAASAAGLVGGGAGIVTSADGSPAFNFVGGDKQLLTSTGDPLQDALGIDAVAQGMNPDGSLKNGKVIYRGQELTPRELRRIKGREQETLRRRQREAAGG